MSSAPHTAQVTQPVDIRIERVDWLDPRAVAARAAMDAETGAMYAGRTANNSPEINKLIDGALVIDPASIQFTIIALDGDDTVGHTALRPFHDELEVKKVFVARSHRGRGVARALLAHAEEYGRAQGVPALILQTGNLQVDAIALYEKIGYTHVPPFGAYIGFPGAVCMRKPL